MLNKEEGTVVSVQMTQYTIMSKDIGASHISVTSGDPGNIIIGMYTDRSIESTKNTWINVMKEARQKYELQVGTTYNLLNSMSGSGLRMVSVGKRKEMKLK